VAEQPWAAHLTEAGRPKPHRGARGAHPPQHQGAGQGACWRVTDAQLDDRHIAPHGAEEVCVWLQKRMAVELAKTALWLHTFTVGAPLTFWTTT
jgi:hypothetical protein